MDQILFPIASCIVTVLLLRSTPLPNTRWSMTNRAECRINSANTTSSFSRDYCLAKRLGGSAVIYPISFLNTCRFNNPAGLAILKVVARKQLVQIYADCARINFPRDWRFGFIRVVCSYHTKSSSTEILLHPTGLASAVRSTAVVKYF